MKENHHRKSEHWLCHNRCFTVTVEHINIIMLFLLRLLIQLACQQQQQQLHN